VSLIPVAVVDTGGKFAAGIADTGINDTGDKFCH
jgi:hypothetical protein